MSPSETKEKKTLLRLQLRERLHQLSQHERSAKSLIITRKILNLDEYLRARRVFIYVSTPFEVQTQELIRKSLLLKKEVYVPHISKEPGTMTARRISDFDRDLSKGAFGILEPSSDFKNCRIGSLDFIAAPGLGFNRHGARLGRGGGYFDRFMEKAAKAYKIGLAFREQITRKKIPMEPHDIYMNAVITD